MHDLIETIPKIQSTRTQRVELIAFPDKTGEALRHEIRGHHGRDCLRFRDEILAPDVLLGESLVRCIWLKGNDTLTTPTFDGIVIAVGKKLSATLHAEAVAVGYTALIDLEQTNVTDAASLISAYAKQAATHSSKHRSSTRQPTVAAEPSDAATAFLAASVEMLEIGVYVLDTKRRNVVTIWNNEMERLFNLKKSEAIGRPIDELFEDLLVRDVFREMTSAYSRNRAIFPSKGTDRSNFIADISKTQLEDNRGNPFSVVGIIQDVTTRIHSENRLIAAFNELESSKEKLEQSNLEIRKGIVKAKKLAVVAQSSNKAKSYFLSNISHELRTPLNSIVSLTYALLEGTFGSLNPKQLENLEIVSDSSKHLQSLINDILDLSKIELGKMNLRFTPTSIEDMARSSIRMIEQEAKAKEVSCILEMRTKIENIDADAKRLRQILLNLLVNAVKFSKPNTQVTLVIEEEPETQSVKFSITDHGIGIQESDFAKIFSPFTQIDDSLSRQYEGTGLGLAIASKFVELHGGGLRLRSTLNKGSTFTVSLPIYQEPRGRDATALLTLAEIATTSRNPQNLLLIVDETESSALRIKKQVEQLTPLRTVVALPNEISAYADQIAPKAVFVDLNIVGIHGADWIRNAKKLPSWKKTKWVAIGSLDIPENHATAERLGFTTSSCKPIPMTLLSRILS